MRLHTFVTLCACALYARAATIPANKKLDDLDNVDLDNVEPELVDQPTITDLDNNLRKTADIPVKVIEEPTVLDENSNDYIPDKDDNIIIKRIEIDLNNPGPPQRQEHETQNPENFGENERAVFAIIQKAQEAQKVFTKGLQAVSDSFKGINGPNENLPGIQQKLKILKETFTNEIEKLNVTIRNNLKPESIESNGVQRKISKLEIVDKRLENLALNFNVGVDTLNEGVELFTILKEEDEIAKTKAVTGEKNEDQKADGDAASTSAAQNPPAQVPTNSLSQYLTNFQQGISHAISNVTSVFQNAITGQGSGGGNPIINFFQGISLPNFISGQNPSQAPPAQAQQDQPQPQSDTAVSAPAPASTSAPWGPQAFIQQVQNTFQSIVNPGQPNQQAQPTTAAPQAGPLAQAFQNIVQFIQNPAQALLPQQPQNSQNPTPAPEKVPQNQSAPENAQSVQADAIPAANAVAPSLLPVATVAPVVLSVPAAPAAPVVPSVPAASVVPSVPAAPVVPAAPAASEAPAAPAPNAQALPQAAPPQETQAAPPQGGPIQQFVQNNPIIKGIQNAVQRIQRPGGETPREEIIEEEKENADNKGLHRPGHHGHNGDNNDCNRLNEKNEEPKEEIAAEETEIESEIKPEDKKTPSLSDKTE